MDTAIMAKREDRDALWRYADDEILPGVLREIARLALARGFTQESLAKKLGSNSGGIHRHFRSRAPREGTLHDYAAALGIQLEYLLLLRHGRFVNKTTENKWLNNVGLVYQSDQYTPEASEAIKRDLLALSEEKRFRCLGSFAIAWYRADYMGEAVLGLHEARAAFEAAAASEQLDTSRYRRNRVPGEDRFLKLWDAIGDVLFVHEFDVVLELVRALQLKRGIDPAPMDAKINEDPPYQAWREGRLERKAGQ